MQYIETRYLVVSKNGYKKEVKNINICLDRKIHQNEYPIMKKVLIQVSFVTAIICAKITRSNKTGRIQWNPVLVML